MISTFYLIRFDGTSTSLDYVEHRSLTNARAAIRRALKDNPTLYDYTPYIIRRRRSESGLLPDKYFNY